MCGTLRAADSRLTTVACIQAVQENFGITVHRRSLERALAGKTAQFGVRSLIPEAKPWMPSEGLPPTSSPPGWSRKAHRRERGVLYPPWLGDMVPDQARGQNTTRNYSFFHPALQRQILTTRFGTELVLLDSQFDSQHSKGRSRACVTRKVTQKHLELDAYLYIRQSTPRPGRREYGKHSTPICSARSRRVAGLAARTYPRTGLRPWQIGLTVGRPGRVSEKLRRCEVALGKAGLVMGLEVSRLARNSADWHRLLELCSLAGALILDEDGIYDPSCFNDRLLLGLKGTMSEAELHFLKARMRGGVINKARRGELEIPPPIGPRLSG